MIDDQHQQSITLGIQNLAALGDCTCNNLRQATRAVTQIYEAALEPSGLKVTQLPILGVAATDGPLTMSALAKHLLMDRTTLTRNLKPLERAGLVQIEPGVDRRARLVSITETGREALAQALPLRQAAQDSLVEALGRFQWGVLMDNLRATIAATRKLS